MDSTKKGASAAAHLSDDLIVEILSRLPVKSICRFKCVSWHWYGLITNREHRKKIPQTLSGFFHRPYRLNHGKDMITFPDFVGITGYEGQPFSDPSLKFMTGYRMIIPKICCNGLLFCLCWKISPSDEANYVVCNPATEKWVVLPGSNHDSGASAYHLGFDPAISPDFHVFQIIDEDEDYGFVAGVNVYSSETGVWSYNENGWGNELRVVERGAVFLNGKLHLLTNDLRILTVDAEGKAWRIIHLLESMRVENFFRGPLSFIGQSQGRLYYINTRDRDTSILSVWILEDYDSDEWIFRYNISTAQVFGEKNLVFERDYGLIAIHPECNLIFFVWRCEEDVLMSYDMDRGKVCVICNLKERFYSVFLPYLPYVPFLSDSLPGH
ncbi:unnamed protein product [Urochloa humidicola]